MDHNDIVNRLRDELAVYHKTVLPLKPEHNGLEAAKRHAYLTHNYPDPTELDRLDEDGVYSIYHEQYNVWLEGLHRVVSDIILLNVSTPRQT